MAVETSNTNLQYFSSTGTETHTFTRSVTNLVITFSGDNNMSLDGYNFMPMGAGTYQLDHLGFVKNISFTGTGVRTGFGIAL